MPVQFGAGSYTSVAALYYNYFKQLNSIVAHLDLDKLHPRVLSRLSIQKLRYLLWGESVGLVYRDLDVERLQNPKLGDLGDSIQQFKIMKILHGFLLELTRPNGIGLDYDSVQDRTSAEQVPQASKIFEQNFKQFVERLTKQSQDEWIPGPKWIIYDPGDFASTIVRKLMWLVDELEEATAAIEPVEAQHARIKAEIMSVSDLENLRLIRDAAKGRYPYIYDSAVDRLTSITYVIEEMFPLTWTDSIATTMRVQSDHASDYSIIGLPTSNLRSNLLRGFAVARSVVPTFRMGRPGRQLQTHTVEAAEQKSPVILKKVVEVERHKIVVLGDQCVGKTALVTMFCNQTIFVSNKGDPTIEDSYTKSNIIDGRPCTLKILDTSGDEVYAILRDGWISSGDAFMLVYSIHNRFSFETARKNGLLICGKAAAIVGNSYTNETENVPRERVVSAAKGLALARELECGFIEVPARNADLVDRAFNAVVRKLRKRDPRRGIKHVSSTV